MIIHSLWIRRKGSDPADTPELIAAWDEYSTDENPEGFKEDCEEALASIGSDLLESRYIDLSIPHGRVLDAFESPTIMGEVR